MADFADAPWLLGWTRRGLSMEQIKQAVERAKASATGEPLRPMTPLHGQGAPQAASRRIKEPDAEVRTHPLATPGRPCVSMRWRSIGHIWSSTESLATTSLTRDPKCSTCCGPRCCRRWIKKIGSFLRSLRRPKGAEKLSPLSISL